MNSRPAATILAVIAATLLVACGLGGGDTTITGEIHDRQIVLAEASGPHSVWVELTNVGSADCELTAALSDAPEALRVDGGRVDLALAGSGSEAEQNLLGYVEVDGSPAGGEGAAAVNVPAGSVARMQLAMTGTPDTGERVILCNGPGDYEAGRYAVLAFDR